MPSSRNFPVPQSTLAGDRLSIKALKDIANYTPHRPEHGVEALLALEAAVAQVEDELKRSQLAVNAARIKLTELSWALHRNVVGARDEISLLFGPDSHEVHAIGRKRASERRRPARRTTSA